MDKNFNYFRLKVKINLHKIKFLFEGNLKI